jgi:PmbA protein
MNIDITAGHIALERAAALGADEAEAFLERGAGLSIKVFEGKVEQFSYSEAAGLGIRVFIGRRTGRSYTSDLSEPSVGEAVASAMESARLSPEDEHRGLPDADLFPRGAESGERIGDDLDIWSDDVAEVAAGEKIEFALDMERKARAYDERVRGIDTTLYSDEYGDVVLMNTRGLRAGFRASICYGYVVPMAGEGEDSQTGFGFTAGHSFAELDAEAAAKEASSMAVDLLGGKQVESTKVPVLFDNLTCAELIAMLGSALSAEQVVKGKSFLAGRLSSAIASPALELIDDGLMKGGYGTSPFDGEGVATSQKKLIEAGTLQSYLHNCYTASRMETRTTGNAGRGSFRSPIGVTPTNLVVKRGDASHDELRSGMGSGFEVLELQGTHAGMNIVTGEISVGAKGFWVENGRRAHAVREVTVAGNLAELLMNITAFGSNLRFTPLLGGIGAPSMLVEGLVVGGT